MCVLLCLCSYCQDSEWYDEGVVCLLVCLLKTADDIEQALEAVNQQHILSSVFYDVRVRRKEKRKANKITSRVCEHPLDFFQSNDERDMMRSKILGFLEKTNLLNRDPIFGCYGASGIGKSRFIDYLCNESDNPKQYAFVPITLNDPMPLQDGETIDVANHQSNDDTHKILCIRLIFSYFLSISRNSRESFTALVKVFERFHDLFVKTNKIDFDAVFASIKEEIEDGRKQMVFLVDDIGVPFGFDKKEVIEKFLSDVMILQRKKKAYMVVVTTFDHEPTIKTSKNTVHWYAMKGLNIFQEYARNVLARKGYPVKKRTRELELLFKCFGDHTRSAAVLFNAICDEGGIYDELFKNIDKHVNYNKILASLVNDYFCNNIYGSMLPMMTALFSRQYGTAFEKLFCHFGLGIRYFPQKDSTDNESSYYSLLSHGIIEETNNCQTDSKQDNDEKKEKKEEEDSVQYISVSLGVLFMLGSVGNDFFKQNSFTELGNNLRRISKRLFYLLSIDWNCEIGEEIVGLQYLIKLNCAKYYQSYVDSEFDRSLSKIVMLTEKIKGNEDEINFEAIDWDQISRIKRNPNEYFPNFAKMPKHSGVNTNNSEETDTNSINIQNKKKKKDRKKRETENKDETSDKLNAIGTDYDSHETYSVVDDFIFRL